MAHVRDDEWVDFVRGTLSADRAAAIAAHLERGCARCLRTRDLWDAVVQTAGREHMYMPPNDALRVVRAQFGASGERRGRSPVLAGLVFDSLREARAVGVRGRAAGPRHLLYQAGPLSIDLRLEAAAGSAGVILMGQVADAGRAPAGAGKCRAAIVDGDRELCATAANRLGEFTLQFAPDERLALAVTVEQRRPVLVQLEDVLRGG